MPTGIPFESDIGGIDHDFARDTDEREIVLGGEMLADAALLPLREARSTT